MKPMMLRSNRPIAAHLTSLRVLRHSQLTRINSKVFRSTSQHPGRSENEKAQPYSAIPGPRGYPLIGTALDYGGENKNNITKVIKQRFGKYGNIYKEKMIPGFPEQVVICDPKDIETVFRADGEWPIRPEGGDLVLKIREKADLVPGILQLHGKAWHDQRMPMSKFMMVPRKVAEYHEELNAITDDLIRNVHHLRDPNSSVISDVTNLLFKWSFESVAYFMLGRRMGALNVTGDMPPDCKTFLEEARAFLFRFMDLIFSVPLYKIYPTKLWKDVVKHQINVKEVAMKFIKERLGEIEEEQKARLERERDSDEAPDKVDFLTYLFYSGKMSLEEVTSNIFDLLSAGVDTSSYTLGWNLYCLATNPEAQEKLRSEVQQVVGSEKIVTPAHINQMSYLRSCIKETMRLYPTAGINQRRLQQDVVLSGYCVPSGTEVMTPMMPTNRSPELFHDPDCFMPERWSKENKDTLPNMFSYLPFGFGPRMCVGRRLAELEIQIALAHVVKHFSLEYPDKEPMGYNHSFLLMPERQLDVTFNDIKN